MKTKGSDSMGLNYVDQVHLLKDILADHQSDCCGTTAEYEQLERIIKSLMINGELDANMKSILEDIYRYSQSGRSAASMNSHISENQENLAQWIEKIGSYS
jgi:ketol-acid reductoisomerase